ncbi:cap-specific mRNA (nucleoside-2'-O-)-methyltransferase 2-like [Palaemon carinicauda]|uniref:cap-specific mRNA (nucleoside-2'-O-)-methyltransferase 2-like n=1 Tax=Palaemon carinicauda TaxID=392227 RepID=UPI0035B5DD31
MEEIKGVKDHLESKEFNNSERQIDKPPTSSVDAGASHYPMDKFVSEDGKHGKYGNNRWTRGGMQNKRHQRNATNSNFGKRKRIDNSNHGHMKFEGREYNLLEYTDYVQAQMDIESHFNKKFSFQKPPEDGCNAWKLPAAKTMFTQTAWLDDDLQAEKTNLNEVKSQLGYKDIAGWHAHTKNINPAENIAYEVRRRASPEMVTQAWLKFYEIVNNYDVIPLDEDFETSSEEEKENKCNEKPFYSVHLCEAPGAFIVSLNHYLALQRPHLKVVRLECLIGEVSQCKGTG